MIEDGSRGAMIYKDTWDLRDEAVTDGLHRVAGEMVRRNLRGVNIYSVGFLGVVDQVDLDLVALHNLQHGPRYGPVVGPRVVRHSAAYTHLPSFRREGEGPGGRSGRPRQVEQRNHRQHRSRGQPDAAAERNSGGCGQIGNWHSHRNWLLVSRGAYL